MIFRKHYMNEMLHGAPATPQIKSFPFRDGDRLFWVQAADMTADQWQQVAEAKERFQWPQVVLPENG